jgi:hypothetical protein
MLMPPALRKLALIVHITASVGWTGAVAAFLALAVAGITSENPEVVRSAYVAMDVVIRSVIVPLSIAALVTGLLQSLGTTWGLFRHYWVLGKLVLTTVSTFLLFSHTPPVSYTASVAMAIPLSDDELGALRVDFIFEAAAAILVLLMITALSVFKPRGLTPYGRRKLLEQRVAPPAHGYDPGSS